MRRAMRCGTVATALFTAFGANAVNAVEPVGSAVQASAPSESRKFWDWIAVCDNGLRCVAIGPGVEPDTGWLHVGMDAGPDAKPTVALGLWSSELGDGRPPISLDVDGRSWPVGYDGEYADYPSGTIRQGDAPAVVAALAVARSVEVRLDGEVGTMSPSGAAAALLWIDEKQGRLSTTTALVRRGDRPASDVPAPPALPVVTPAPPIAQFEPPTPSLPPALTTLPEVADCWAETAHNPETQRLMVQRIRLDARTELWAVPCFIAAYQNGEIWYLTDTGGTNPRRVTLAYPARSPLEGDDWNGTTGGGFDPETRTLSAFNKRRGLSDCGSLTTWTWTGRAFVLSNEQAMTECWGLPFDLWPSTWRSR